MIIHIYIAFSKKLIGSKALYNISKLKKQNKSNGIYNITTILIDKSISVKIFLY